MHTLLDLHGPIPTFIHITNGKVHDVNVLDEIALEAGAFYVMDRGYIDFKRLYRFTVSSAFFVVRTKANVLLERRHSRLVDKTTGCAATIQSFSLHALRRRRIRARSGASPTVIRKSASG
jgi:hypothetical protein